MPQVFRLGSYWVYFWTNKNKPLEPIHVHISEGHPNAYATKKCGSPKAVNAFYVITNLKFPIKP